MVDDALGREMHFHRYTFILGETNITEGVTPHVNHSTVGLIIYANNTLALTGNSLEKVESTCEKLIKHQKIWDSALKYNKTEYIA